MSLIKSGENERCVRSMKRSARGSETGGGERARARNEKFVFLYLFYTLLELPTKERKKERLRAMITKTMIRRGRKQESVRNTERDREREILNFSVLPRQAQIKKMKILQTCAVLSSAVCLSYLEWHFVICTLSPSPCLYPLSTPSQPRVLYLHLADRLSPSLLDPDPVPCRRL